MNEANELSLNGNLLTRKEVQDYLQVSETTLWRYMNSQENPLPYLKIGRKVRFKEEDVQAFVSAHAVSK